MLFGDAILKNEKSIGMSDRQAERIIETYANAVRNGEQWAHDVFLHRGTDKYERSLLTLNEAFKTKYIERTIQPLKALATASMPKRARR